MFLESNERVQVLNNKKQQIMGVTPQRGCPRFKTAINTNAEELQHINTAISIARDFFQKVKGRNKELKNSFGESATSFEQFIN